MYNSATLILSEQYGCSEFLYPNKYIYMSCVLGIPSKLIKSLHTICCFTLCPLCPWCTVWKSTHLSHSFQDM